MCLQVLGFGIWPSGIIGLLALDRYETEHVFLVSGPHDRHSPAHSLLPSNSTRIQYRFHTNFLYRGLCYAALTQFLPHPLFNTTQKSALLAKWLPISYRNLCESFFWDKQNRLARWLFRQSFDTHFYYY